MYRYRRNIYRKHPAKVPAAVGSNIIEIGVLMETVEVGMAVLTEENESWRSLASTKTFS